MFRSNKSDNFEASIQQTHSVRLRIVLTSIILLGLLSILIGRLAHLQIVSYHKYVALSTDNRVRVVPVPPARGHIYDRNGRVLAGNETAYRLAITANNVEDMDSLLEKLSNIIPLSHDELTGFHRSLRTNNKHNAVVLKNFLSPEEVARVSVDRYRLPGVSIITDLHRVYAAADYTSHVVGTLSQIDQRDQQRLDAARYRGIQYVGKSGIEQVSEDELVGYSGHHHIETNAHGQKIRVLSQEAPSVGSDIYLSIDLDLQKVAYDALGDKVGALVAMSPSTGRILAMVSKPSFDANQFGISGTQEKRVDLLNADGRPLLNRSIQGQYSPGSTIKPFLAFAALESGFSRQSVYCPGWYALPNYSRKFRCWKKPGHGQVDLLKAIAESCDVYFYALARELGIDELYYQLSKFGFGSSTGIELTYEATGLVPSKEWKQWAKQEPWYEGETLITGIGQGATMVSMLQLAQATSIIATKGRGYRPQLILKTIDEQGRETLHEPDLIGEIDFDQRHFDWVTKAMEEVVHGDGGTARKINYGLNYRMAGKTGTVQIISRPKDEDELNLEQTPKKLHPHGIFIAFAPADHPEIALAVIVENGGSGSAIAPIARAVIDHHLSSLSDPAPAQGDSFALITEH